MNNIEKDIEQYFAEKEVPEISLDEQQKLKNIVKLNKSRKKISIFKRATTIVCSFCLLALLLIPSVVLINKYTTPPPPPIYYGDDEATKANLEITDLQTIITENYPKYNFIFEEMSFTQITGFYNPKNNSLLALQIKGYQIDTSVLIEINLIASEQFIFSAKDTYTLNPTHTKTETYELYKTVKQSAFGKSSILAYVVFEDHDLYLDYNSANEDLLNKFL